MELSTVVSLNFILKSSLMQPTISENGKADLWLQHLDIGKFWYVDHELMLPKKNIYTKFFSCQFEPPY